MVCSILHSPPTRRKGAASCTTTICGSVFPLVVTQALGGRTEGPAPSTLLLLLIQLVEYLLVPRVELSILRLRLRALSASAAALSLGALDCVSLVSRSC